MSPALTYAIHNLDDVATIEVIGWPGKYAVTARKDDRQQVQLRAVVRDPGESYEFSGPDAQGVLQCRTNLLGKAECHIDPGHKLEIRLPPARINDITVVVKP